ncbi:unnamed protein product [Musa acuminata subsp. malaccensis]|uniref:(wild Malaysian banana) hypothetical protein n=1 Tax=Musa acuminata subsp. malaccensis TaxID=214687 RepID=A0A804HQP4_MUSAM|nr:unnamed protein product [Musa acuminata subsp. malaccensis]
MRLIMRCIWASSTSMAQRSSTPPSDVRIRVGVSIDRSATNNI